MHEFFGKLIRAGQLVVSRARESAPVENRFGTRWDYTRSAREVAAQYGEPENTFDGYPIIGRDSSVLEGVYFCQGNPEVLVVDNTADGGWLNQQEQWLRNRIDTLAQNQVRTESMVLAETFALVRQMIPYDPNTVVKKNAGLRGYTKIHLREYQGGGVCRHQALLCAYLLERMTRIGYLHGSVSLDRSMTRYLGHAWVRYTNEHGRVIIIDPASEGGILFLDTLNSTDSSRIFYERPDESVDSILLARELPPMNLAERWLWLIANLRASFSGRHQRPPRAPLARATP